MSLYATRVSRLQNKMVETQVDYFFCFHYTEISYFTGSQLGSFLMVPQQGKIILFTRSAEQRIKKIDSGIEVIPFRSYKDVVSFLSISNFSKISIPLTTSPFAIIYKFCEFFHIDIKTIIDGQTLLNSITYIKTPQEIACIKNAATDISEILNTISIQDILGKTEAEISGWLFYKLRQKGFIGEYQFRSITPFTGPTVLTKDSIFQASTVHTTYSGSGINNSLAIGSGNNIIEEGVPFIIDIMQNKNGLFCDITRTFIIGQINPILEKRYNDLLNIFNYIQSLCICGKPIGEIYTETLQMVDNLGYSKNFMGLFPNISPFIGHNIGSWVDEFPAFAKNISVKLEENMVFALEPKFYFEDGNSPGIESTFVQTINGPVSLDTLSNNIMVL